MKNEIHEKLVKGICQYYTKYNKPPKCIRTNIKTLKKILENQSDDYYVVIPHIIDKTIPTNCVHLGDFYSMENFLFIE